MKFSASERHSTAAEQHSTAAEQTSAAAEQTSAAAAKHQQQPNKINSSGLTTASGDEILLGPVRPIRALHRRISGRRSGTAAGEP